VDLKKELSIKPSNIIKYDKEIITKEIENPKEPITQKVVS